MKILSKNSDVKIFNPKHISNPIEIKCMKENSEDDIIDNEISQSDFESRLNLPNSHRSNIINSLKKRPKVIRINSPFRMKWDLFLMCLAIFNFFSLLFYASFDPETIESFIISTIVNLLFCLDIILNFFTTYIDTNGEEITDKVKIAKNYFKFNFWVDLIVSIPIDNLIIAIYYDSDDGIYWQLTDTLQIIRIVRLTRILRYSRTTGKAHISIKITYLMLYLIMTTHFVTSVWIMIARFENKDWIPFQDFYLRDTEVWNQTVWNLYFAAFYTGVCIVRGAEPAATHTSQLIFATIFIIAGGFITALLFGEMIEMITKYRYKQIIIEKKIEESISSLTEMNIDKELTKKIINFLTSAQGSLQAQEEFLVFKKYVSPSLQNEVSECIYSPIISKSPILENEAEFVNQLIRKLKIDLTKPEKQITQIGEQSNSMYFIVSGECEVRVKDKYGNNFMVCFLASGAHFGEIGLIYKTLRTANVSSVDYCTIAELNGKEFETLITLYPQIISNFILYTENYKDPYKSYLISILLQANYFGLLQTTDLNQLIYGSEILTLEPGEYLFKPGDDVKYIYIIADGELEYSITINERHLHMKKKEANIKDTENSPKVSKIKTKTYELWYDFDLSKIDGLKNKAEIVPIFVKKNLVGYINIDDELPYKFQTLGDYPQEIILDTLTPGTLLHAYYAIQQNIHQLQCKAIRPCKIYAINYDIFEGFVKKNRDLKSEISKLKYHSYKERDYIDYKTIDNHYFSLKYQWKSIIIRIIIQNREDRKSHTSKIGDIIPKITAILACERAKNYDLIDQISNDRIPPHYVTSDGFLDPAALDFGMSSALPRTHPILKIFQKIQESVNNKEGNLVKQYNTVKRYSVEQELKLKSVNMILDGLNEKMKILVDNLPAEISKLDSSTKQKVVSEDGKLNRSASCQLF